MPVTHFPISVPNVTTYAVDPDNAGLFMARIGFYEAQEDWRDAADDQKKARRKVAEFRSRDLTMSR